MFSHRDSPTVIMMPMLVKSITEQMPSATEAPAAAGEEEEALTEATTSPPEPVQEVDHLTED